MQKKTFPLEKVYQLLEPGPVVMLSTFYVVDMKLTSKYGIFILEVLKAWMTTSKKQQRMIHHCGNGNFIVDGKKIKLLSKKK